MQNRVTFFVVRPVSILLGLIDDILPANADAISPVSYPHLTDCPGPEFSVRVFGPPPAVAPSSGITYDYWKGGTLKELKDQAIELIASAFANSSRGMSIGIGHHMHGQICRVPSGATPLTRTSGQFTYFSRRKLAQPSTGRSGDGVGGRVVVSDAAVFEYRLRELSQ